MQNTSNNSVPLNELSQPATNKGVVPGSLSNLGAAIPSLPSPLTYSASQTAALIGVTRDTVYRLVKRRVFEPVPHLRHKKIPRTQVHAFINGGGKE